MDDLTQLASDGEIWRRRDLVARGFTDDEIRAAVRRGQLERLCRGAVCAPVAESDRFEAARERYRRQVVARAQGLSVGVVSHTSAAVLHGMPVPTSAMHEVHATISSRSGARVAPGLRMHVARLGPDELVTRYAVRTTAPDRTVIDVARSVPLMSAVAAADHALQAGLVTVESLAASLRSAARRPGMSAARRALAQIDGRSESVGESRLRLIMVGLGLPRPELQIEVRDSAGAFLGRCDLGFPEDAVLIEFDGLQKYRRLLRPGETAVDTVVREKRREEALVEAGFIVLRIIWADFQDPVTLRRRVLRAIERGRRNRAAGLVSGQCSWQRRQVLVP